MPTDRARTALILGAACSGLVAAVHLGTLMAGAAWYRFFGATSLAARVERGDFILPTLLTLVLALAFTAGALYALSGAGLLRRLAHVRPVLLGLGAVYVLRGMQLLVDLLAVLRGGQVPVRAFVFSGFSALAGALHLIGAVPKPATRPAPRRRRANRPRRKKSKS